MLAAFALVLGVVVMTGGGRAGASRSFVKGGDPASGWSRAPSLVAGASKPALGAAASSGRQFRGTVPPSSCYYSIFSDPKDASELDGQTYGAAYDCPTATWRFSVKTFDSWPSSELDFMNVGIDSDGDPSTGCGGFEWLLEGAFVSGGLKAGLFSTPDCSTANLVSNTDIGHPDGTTIDLTVPNSALGSTKVIRWLMFLKGANESAGDDMPDSGASPPYHREAGFSDGDCSGLPTPFGTPPGASYAMVGNTRAAAAALASAGQPNVQAAGQPGGVVRFGGDPLDGAAALASHGIQATVTPDHVLAYSATPNDLLFSQQWYLPAVGAPAAWDHTKGSASVIVADLDSGVDPTHPDLAGKLVPGYDAETGQPLSTTTNSDNVGHGTATAGVIGAATDNVIGVASLGWDTKVMPIKLGDVPLVSSEVAGLHFAADHGAPIANLSFGGACPDANEAAAVTYAQSKGMLLVAAAGNDATTGDHPSYPAADPDVFAVGATAFDGSRAFYSNTGDYVDIVAPGGSADGNPAHDMVLLAPGGGFQAAAGTSFSSPLVAAAAALAKAVNPKLTAADLRALLLTTAKDLGPAGRDPSFGAGLLQADALVLQAPNPPTTTTTTLPPTTTTTAPPPTTATTQSPATTQPAARSFLSTVTPTPVATPQAARPTFVG